MNIRIRFKWVVGALILGVLAWLFPYLMLIGFGISNNLDVGSAISHIVSGNSKDKPTISEDEVPYLEAPIIWNGLIENQELNECSGMAWSTEDNIVWAHNDSGGETRIYGFEPDGTDLGHVNIDIPQMGDWEDMTRFTLNGESYLLIADVGDNYRWRPQLYLFVVKEPTREALEERQTVTPDWMTVYRYPEGYRDSEGVAVDAEAGWVYLASKRTVPAEIYRVQLKPESEMTLDSTPITAERVADLTGIPRPNEIDLLQDPKWGSNRSMPTAMDMQANRAVVVTYKDAYLYDRLPAQTWAETLSGIPSRIALPHAYARESVTLTEDGKTMLIGAERDGNDAANLYQISLP